jgi:hypothetical protein
MHSDVLEEIRKIRDRVKKLEDVEDSRPCGKKDIMNIDKAIQDSDEDRWADSIFNGIFGKKEGGKKMGNLGRDVRILMDLDSLIGCIKNKQFPSMKIVADVPIPDKLKDVSVALIINVE